MDKLFCTSCSSNAVCAHSVAVQVWDVEIYPCKQAICEKDVREWWWLLRCAAWAKPSEQNGKSLRSVFVCRHIIGNHPDAYGGLSRKLCQFSSASLSSRNCSRVRTMCCHRHIGVLSLTLKKCLVIMRQILHLLQLSDKRCMMIISTSEWLWRTRCPMFCMFWWRCWIRGTLISPFFSLLVMYSVFPCRWRASRCETYSKSMEQSKVSLSSLCTAVLPKQLHAATMYRSSSFIYKHCVSRSHSIFVRLLSCISLCSPSTISLTLWHISLVHVPQKPHHHHSSSSSTATTTRVSVFLPFPALLLIPLLFSSDRSLLCCILSISVSIVQLSSYFSQLIVFHYLYAFSFSFFLGSQFSLSDVARHVAGSEAVWLCWFPSHLLHYPQRLWWWCKRFLDSHRTVSHAFHSIARWDTKNEWGQLAEASSTVVVSSDWFFFPLISSLLPAFCLSSFAVQANRPLCLAVGQSFQNGPTAMPLFLFFSSYISPSSSWALSLSSWPSPPQWVCHHCSRTMHWPSSCQSHVPEDRIAPDCPMKEFWNFAFFEFRVFSVRFGLFLSFYWFPQSVFFTS